MIQTPGIPEAHWNDRQRLLYETMSEISEDCYCAGWMTGLELALWNAMQSGDMDYGRGEIDRDQLELCSSLSVELGGWIVWIDDGDIPGLPASEWGPRFISTAQWNEMVAEIAGNALSPETLPGD